MQKTNHLESPLVESKVIPSKEELRTKHQGCFSSVKGNVSFYQLKSIARQIMLENITISGILNENGTVSIYCNEAEIIDVFSKSKDNAYSKNELSFLLLPNALFYKGSIMDGFTYDCLSEETSTHIVNGNVVPYSKTLRASSIGKLKRVEDIIHLNSSLRITYNNNLFKNKTHLKWHSLGIDISMQFKQAVA